MDFEFDWRRSDKLQENPLLRPSSNSLWCASRAEFGHLNLGSDQLSRRYHGLLEMSVNVGLLLIPRIRAPN